MILAKSGEAGASVDVEANRRQEAAVLWRQREHVDRSRTLRSLELRSGAMFTTVSRSSFDDEMKTVQVEMRNSQTIHDQLSL